MPGAAPPPPPPPPCGSVRPAARHTSAAAPDVRDGAALPSGAVPALRGWGDAPVDWRAVVVLAGGRRLRPVRWLGGANASDAVEGVPRYALPCWSPHSTAGSEAGPGEDALISSRAAPSSGQLFSAGGFRSPSVSALRPACRSTRQRPRSVPWNPHPLVATRDPWPSRSSAPARHPAPPLQPSPAPRPLPGRAAAGRCRRRRPRPQRGASMVSASSGAGCRSAPGCSDPRAVVLRCSRLWTALLPIFAAA